MEVLTQMFDIDVEFNDTFTLRVSPEHTADIANTFEYYGDEY